MEKIQISNSKNEKIAAVINYPKEQTDKLAILCPGYLDSKDYHGLLNLAEKLSVKGYVVIRFDPIGTWESEGDISKYTTTQYLEDIKNVFEYMLKQGNFKHVLLGGHSRGGQVAILYAARDPRISFVLGIMPSSGPIQGQRREEWEKAGIGISSRDLPNKKNEKIEFRVPFQHVLDRDQYDAVGDAGKIKVPIIFIAGELDDIVPAEDVKEIFDNANEPKKFIIIPNIGHNYRHNPNETEVVNTKIMEILEK